MLTLPKTVHTEPQGERIAMRCVHTVAEGVGSGAEADQVQFLSSVDEQPLTQPLRGSAVDPYSGATATRTDSSAS